MDRNKVLMIFGGAWLSALLLSWFLYSTTAGAKQTRLKTVVAAARDIPAGVRLKNLQWQARSDRLAEAILRFQYGPIKAGRQLD